MTDSICVILAGGLGTRLRVVISDVPKALAPVAGRPFLDRQIEVLIAGGITSIVLALGYGADLVIDALPDFKFNSQVSCVTEPRPLGTGGAARFVMTEQGYDEIILTNGDTLLDADITAMLRPLDHAAGELVRIGTVHVSDSGRYGRVKSDDAGRVVRFEEKEHKGPGEINGGIYRLHSSAFEGFEQREVLSLEHDVLPVLAQRRKVTAHQLDGNFIDIGVPEDYQAFCERYA